MTMGHSMGTEDAPVVVSVWGDYQCPFCRRFALGPERQLRETLVRNGQVRFVWNDFPFLGPESYWAAEAARAAGEQGTFWPYHDKLYEGQGRENAGTFSAENLLRFAQELGLDLNRFVEDLQSGTPAREIAAEKRRGDEIGVSWTPTVNVSDEKLPGVPTWDELRRVIQSRGERAA